MSDVHVIAHLHPFLESERDEFNVPDGTTVAELVAKHVKAGRSTVIVNANVIRPEKWSMSLRSGDHVIVKCIPEAEGIGNYILGGLTALAGLVLAPFTGGASLVLTAFGLGSIGLTVGASYLNDVIASATDDSIYGLSAGQNTQAKWKGTPIILGKTKTTPYQVCAASRISGTDGEYQDILVQYLVGFGPLRLSNLRLGDAMLSPNASDVRSGLISDIENFEGVTLEVRQGGDAPTLFPYIIHEANPQVLLSGGEEKVRETEAGTERISVDITASALYNSTGTGKSSVSVKIEARYRALGSSTAWASCPLLGYFDGGSNTITRAKSHTIRFNVAKTIAAGDAEYSATGEYQVMLKRVTADTTDDKVVDIFYWTALRSMKPSASVWEASELAFPVIVGLAIRANDTISGAIGLFSCIAESLVPVWDGLASGAAHWATAAITSNPAAVYLNLLRGPGNPDPCPDSTIDWPAFEAWYTFCATKGFGCDGELKEFQRLDEALPTVAATGRAAPVLRDGKYSVVVDMPKTNVVQYFGPHNTKGFTWTQEYPDRPHALRMQFAYRDLDYEQAERIVYDPDYTAETAEKYESVPVKLIVDREAIYKHAMYKIACSKLRASLYQWEAPVAATISEVGDLVGVTHDVPEWGIADAVIKAVTLDESDDIVGFSIDNTFMMEAGKTYQILVVSQAGTQYTRTITTVAGGNTSIAFSTPIPAEDPVQSGDRVYFGETDSIFARLIIVGKANAGNGAYILYAIDEAPGVHTADTGTIPAWDPQITKAKAITPVRVVENLPNEEIANIRDNVAAGLATAIATVSHVFFDQPVGPYKRGDLWIHDAALYQSTTDRGEGEYISSDWVWCIRANMTAVIESTNGDKFRPGQSATTTLIGRAFRNGVEVTNDLPDSAFKWTRKSFFPTSEDAVWNANHQTGYRTVEVTTDSIYARATYTLEISE